MKLDNFSLDPSPSDVDRKAEITAEEDVAGYWDGIPMTSDELAAEVNAMERGELPFPAPCPREWTAEAERMAEAESPSDLSMDYPWGPRFPEDEELRRRGIRETMFDTLPEMDQIIENECIM
jgi:hypothetical protein